tara:strand:- start:955 stop:3540 length:2586 start_codon:yes stop_codon:yes gene_type:complete
MENKNAYNAKLVEKKWQKFWQEKNLYKATSNQNKKDYYVLEMFPYPSGKIHMGHVRVYTLGDVLARYKRATGFNVLHPMGWDAFGMPAENAAFENKIHPAIWTKKNINNMKTQLKAMGLSYDWDLEFATCDPLYIECQQKIFLSLYKQDLAYRKEAWANWDPVDQTVLSNEQVIDGKGWRSGALVERKKLPQWFFRITDYADELIDSLDKLNNWPNQVKIMQNNWIGRSEGLRLSFSITKNISENSKIKEIEVYTTRPDTIFGCSFLAIAPDHPLTKICAQKDNNLKAFIKECNKVGTSEEALEKVDKKGFNTNIKVKHPFLKNKNLPVYVANFVLMSYGTGAIFGVPAHDQRDYDFAKKMNLPIKQVVENKESIKNDILQEAYTGKGKIINSEFLDGMSTDEAKKYIINISEKQHIGTRSKQFRLHDWCASRQRYWGCPVPIILCDHCGIVPVKEDDLPVLLPEDVTFDKIGNPLDHHQTWQKVTCPECGREAKRETQTFDTFVDSAWYPLRYPSPKSKEPIDKKEVQRWCPPQQYVGGIEHAILHLLYARFFTKALKDTKYINFDEPFEGLFCQGMVCHKTYKGKDGWLEPSEIELKGNKAFNKKDQSEIIIGRSEKMSKSKKNIVDPMTIINQYGADTARLFMLSDSPPERDLDWSESGVEGCWKFLKRIWTHFHNYKFDEENLEILNDAKGDNLSLRQNIHKSIKEATNSIEEFKYNSAVAAIRKLSNVLLTNKSKSNNEITEQIVLEGWKAFILMLAPMTPHIAEELWNILDKDKMVTDVSWPQANANLLQNNNITLAIQINGKLKNTIEINQSDKDNKDKIINIILNLDNIKKTLNNNTPKKIISIPGKVVNIVI